MPNSALLIFSFYQTSTNCMVLLPPDALGVLPKYHISVETNCFRPASHITIIRRGETGRGPYVGEFE